MFSFFKEKVIGFYNSFSKKIASIFSGNSVGKEELDKLFQLLVSCDVGADLSRRLIESVKKEALEKSQTSPEEIYSCLKKNLELIFDSNGSSSDLSDPDIIILLGVNGAGKTTSCAKLSKKFADQGNKVLMVAADTFRAAAKDQLNVWSERVGVDIILGKDDQDPASLIFDSCKQFNQGHFDKMIIDTAGRLHTKVNLVKELEKIYKSIKKNCPNAKIGSWIVLDSMLGQTSINQAKIFGQAANLNGSILTKFDGTGKGGVIFAIKSELAIPVNYITFGEDLNSIKKFDSKEFIQGLLEK